MAFTVPDAALSNVLHRALTRRNLNIFSSYSFAYRSDRGVFDAVLHLRRSLSGPKSYVIQYDFSSYFDTIDHAFLLKLLFSRRVFLVSDAESRAIEAFLKHRFAPFSDYGTSAFQVKEKGVPQGSSISLFLSNAAAHDLDLLLEAQNGVFTRFADDVVAITRSYSDAVRVSHAFREHCRDAGLNINYKKSPGIELFVGAPDRERRDFIIDVDDGKSIRNVSYIDYVGHRIESSERPGLPEITLPEKALKRIRRRVSEIIYIHLLQHRRGVTDSLNSSRLGPGFFDWDLVTCINEIRSYIYGGLREAEVRGFIEGGVKLSHVRGLMGFLPLITKVDQLKQLDGWLLSVMRRAQRERVRVVAFHGLALSTLSEVEILTGSWYNFGVIDAETELPSFVRAWRASKKFYRKHGLDRVSATPPYSRVSGYSLF